MVYFLLVGDIVDKKLNDLLIIDQKIGDFFYNNEDLSENDFFDKFEKTRYIDKALKIMNKLSNKNVIELLKRNCYLKEFIDFKKFIREYPLNKTYLKQNKDMYIEEYKKLRRTCYYISDIARDNKEFEEYMDVLKVDDVEKYLLSNMPNEQIYSLASETSFWDEKLYLFSYFKNKKKKTI